jgi:2-polyprenyl-3-methyl-5-hydroxy-6-metoxy-1,4-benzoquinol methylase
MDSALIQELNSTTLEEDVLTGFAIDEQGYWDGTQTENHHAFDHRLAKCATELLKNRGGNSIIDLGAGKGRYSWQLKDAGF